MAPLSRLSMLAATILFSGCISIPFPFPPNDYNEVMLEDGNKDKILLLDIDGVITGGTQSDYTILGGTDDTVNSMAERLEKARNDKHVKAIILRVDTPGGGVTPSDVVYRMVREFKEDTEIPIYVSMLDLTASGGYYISMAADKLYAHPTTITGSIGVIAMFPQFADLGDKVGLHMETIKSGENKDMGSPFHNMKDEQRALLQGVIDDMYGRFLSVVEAGRPNIAPERVRELADGRIYTAQQALDEGLVDGILYIDEVIDLLREEQNLPEASVVMYRKTMSETYNSLYAKSPAVRPMAETQTATTNVSLLNVDLAGSAAPRGPVFQYLWVP